MKQAMTNLEMSKIIREIGEYLDVKGIPFKPKAYEKAAYSIENLDEELSEIYKKSGLKAVENIFGIGVSIAEKIEEILKTGKSEYHEKLKKSFPVDIDELIAIEGVGPKMILKLYRSLKIKNIVDLEKAAKAGKIAKISGIGTKIENKILKSLEFLKKSKGRFLLGEILPLARTIEKRLKEFGETDKAAIAGSARRMQETIGDLDFIVSSKNPEKIMDHFVKMPEVSHVYSKGKIKTLVRLKNGVDADIEIVPEKSFGAALLAFTGNKNHNIALRALAEKKGLKLNDYGLWRGNKMIAGKTEDEVYKALGLMTPSPEIRNDSGEIQAALKNNIPDLVGYKRLKGDLQVHSNWTDGENTIEEMAKAAMEAGLEYMAITDHTKSLAMTGGLNEEKLLEQMEEIDRLNERFIKKNFKILKGAEVNILKDGKLDINDEMLEKLDIVGIAVHSHFNLSRFEQTERIIKAMRNKNADILFHPTGRLIKKREAYEVDMEEIIKAAKETGTVLEIDSDPNRLDLKDEYVKKAVESGVKIAIDTDSHFRGGFGFLALGIGQARRGWAKSSDIINTRSWREMLKLIK